MDILTGENLSLIYVYGPHLLVRRSFAVERGWGGWVVLSSCVYYFIRVHENLMQHPSIYKYIDLYKANK